MEKRTSGRDCAETTCGGSVHGESSSAGSAQGPMVGGVPDLVQEESQGTFNPQTLACSEDVRTDDRDLLEVDFC